MQTSWLKKVELLHRNCLQRTRPSRCSILPCWEFSSYRKKEVFSQELVSQIFSGCFYWRSTCFSRLVAGIHKTFRLKSPVGFGPLLLPSWPSGALALQPWSFSVRSACCSLLMNATLRNQAGSVAAVALSCFGGCATLLRASGAVTLTTSRRARDAPTTTVACAYLGSFVDSLTAARTPFVSPACAGTGHFLRSAEMEYVSLIMAEYLSHDVVARLGEVGSVQFTDVSCIPLPLKCLRLRPRALPHAAMQPRRRPFHRTCPALLPPACCR